MNCYFSKIIFMPIIIINQNTNISSKLYLQFEESSCYYRPQTKFAKVMFSQVSVCPQGSLSLCPGGSPSQGDLHPGGVSVRGGLCPGGLCLGGSLSSRVYVHEGLCPGGEGSLSRGSLSWKPLRYCKERSVRILLECILVRCYFTIEWRITVTNINLPHYIMVTITYRLIMSA